MSSSSPPARRSGLLGGSLIVMAGYLLSRATGLLRDLVVVGQLGISPEAGAYRAAFRLPDLLYLVIIGGALGSTLIPAFVDSRSRAGAEYAWRLASAVMNWSLLLLTLASAILLVLAEPLTRALFPGFDPQTLDLTSSLTRLFVLSPLLLGLGGLALSLLNALDRFALPALAPSIYNLGILVGAWFIPQLGVWGPAWGVIGGALCYLLVQLPGLLRAGARYHPTLGLQLPELPLIARQLAPRVLGQSAAQLSITITDSLASRLAQGAQQVAALGTAYQLMLLPYGIFSLSLSTVAFPTLARLHTEGASDEFRARVRRTTGLIMLLTLPAAAALIALAVPLIRLLFQRGAFDQQALELTIAPLLAYATALSAFAVSEILIRSFYAMRRTRIPVLVGLATLAGNLLLGLLVLQLRPAAEALALAFSLANNLECLALIVLLGRSLPGIWKDATLRLQLWIGGLGALLVYGLLTLLLQFSAPFLPFLLVQGSYRWPGDFLALSVWLSAAAIMTGLVYFVLLRLFGLHDLRRLLR